MTIRDILLQSTAMTPFQLMTPEAERFLKLKIMLAYRAMGMENVYGKA